MNLGIPSHFIQFDMLLVIATIDEAVKFTFTIPTGPPHAILCTALLKSFACLPAFTTCYLVRLHL